MKEGKEMSPSWGVAVVVLVLSDGSPSFPFPLQGIGVGIGGRSGRANNIIEVVITFGGGCGKEVIRNLVKSSVESSEIMSLLTIECLSS